MRFFRRKSKSKTKKGTKLTPHQKQAEDADRSPEKETEKAEFSKEAEFSTQNKVSAVVDEKEGTVFPTTVKADDEAPPVEERNQRADDARDQDGSFAGSSSGDRYDSEGREDAEDDAEEGDDVLNRYDAISVDGGELVPDTKIAVEDTSDDMSEYNSKEVMTTSSPPLASNINMETHDSNDGNEEPKDVGFAKNMCGDFPFGRIFS